jgi:hypothetical protein
MARKSPRRDIVEAALAEFQGKPKRTIAKWLSAKHPEEFPTVEDARKCVRYYTGSTGEHGRKAGADIKVDIRQPGTLTIPKGIRQSKRPYVVGPGSWLVCSDFHVPYHDEVAIEAMLRYAVDKGIEHLYLNGDIIDFYRLSRWDKDPRRRNTEFELAKHREVLGVIEPHFDRKVYKIGNHEERLTKRMWQSNPELAVLPRFDVAEVLEVKDRYEVVDSKRKAKFGRLWGFHGHELPRGLTNPVNVARGVWLRVRDRAFTSHWHQPSSHVETSGVSKKVINTYSLGCLCDMTPEYAIVNNWAQGFAVVNVGARGDFNFTNLLCDQGKVYEV